MSCYLIPCDEILNFCKNLDLGINLEQVLKYEKHADFNLAGWIGIITFSVIGEDSCIYDFDVRYAYGLEVLKQNLIDHNYTEERLIRNPIKKYTVRHKIIIYFCEDKTGILKSNKIETVPDNFVIGNYWKSIKHIYLKYNKNEYPWEMPKSFTKSSGFSTTRNLVRMEKSSSQKILYENIKTTQGGLRTKGFHKQSCTHKPLITIVTPVCNGEKYLEQTIQSVINQDYDNVEYIIVDGVSTDSTLDIIKKYRNQIDYWISEPDDGLYYAMDKGIKLGNGLYCGNINADDFYNNNILKDIVENFIDNNIDFLHGNMFIITNTTKKYIKRSIGNQGNINKGMTINHPTVFLKRETYFNIGGYNLNYRVCSDFELMVKLLVLQKEGKKINKFLAFFRQGGFSSKNHSLAIKESHEIRNFYGLKDIKKANIIINLLKDKFIIILTKIFGKKVNDFIFKIKYLADYHY